MLRPRFAACAAALALVVACSDDSTTATGAGPLFEGAEWVAPDENGKLVVNWKPASDPNGGAVDYRVYVSRIQGRELKTAPAVRTDKIGTIITPDKPGDKYFVVVRAANVRGFEDANTLEKSAVASPDKTPPQFGGVTSATPDGNAGAKLTWNAATDDQTPPQGIVYDIFGGSSKDALTQLATSAPGDTQFTFAQLATPSSQYFFKVLARDVGNNVSADTPVVATALGQDATPPTFAGCDATPVAGSKTVTITWPAATDNLTPADQLSYEVYLTPTQGAEDYNQPPAAKVTGATKVIVNALNPGTKYFAVCKVRDTAGNLDTNTNETPFTTVSDVKPPTFAGLTGLDFDEFARTATLKWAAASDDQTGPEALVYDVYLRLGSNVYDFDAPPSASSPPGATSIPLSNLPSRTTLSWVVRARDAAGNHDDNRAELSGVTKTSFSVDVQGVFDRNCAVVGCHVTGPQTGGMNLAPGFSYAQTVGFPAVEKKPLMRISTDGKKENSWLYIKITNPDVGLLMPAPQTGNVLGIDDQNIIQNWIEDGAKQN